MNRKLLIVDDEPGILDAYRIILTPPPQSSIPMVRSSRSSNAAVAATSDPSAELEVFELQCVDTGEQALTAIKKATLAGEPFAGGFFDVKLGDGIDGVEAIRQAKDIDPNLLVVMVTAYQDRSVDEIAKIFGEQYADRWDFMSKPFARNEIIQKARHLVADWDRRKREQQYLKQIEDQQEQLIQAERLAAVGTLARGIGHEFGNVLLGIVGTAELANASKDSERMQNALGVIAKSAQRAGVITRNLQSFVKKEEAREPTIISDLVKECTALLEYEMRKNSVKLIEDYDPKLPVVVVSRVELSQVLMNLIINATHAMENSDKKEITIQAKSANNGLQIKISDTGSGIAPDVLPKVFEPLFTTKGERGSGIGLAVTKRIIEGHQGTVEVDSIQNQGTTFTIWLPSP